MLFGTYYFYKEPYSFAMLDPESYLDFGNSYVISKINPKIDLFSPQKNHCESQNSDSCKKNRCPIKGPKPLQNGTATVSVFDTDPSDPYIFMPPDPDPYLIVRGTDPDRINYHLAKFRIRTL